MIDVLGVVCALSCPENALQLEKRKIESIKYPANRREWHEQKAKARKINLSELM